MNRLIIFLRKKAERFGLINSTTPLEQWPNPELAFVEKYDKNVSEGIPDGHFASGNENDFDEGDPGRIWFRLHYDENDENNEKLILSLYKGRNFKKSTDESMTEENYIDPASENMFRAKSLPTNPTSSRQQAWSTPEPRRTKSSPAKTPSIPKGSYYSIKMKLKNQNQISSVRPKLITDGRTSSLLKRAHDLSETASLLKKHFDYNPSKRQNESTIHRDENSEDVLIYILLYPDPSIQKRVLSTFRGVPDPVFADRVVFQVPKVSIESKTLQMIFALVDRTTEDHTGTRHVLIGDVTYPLKEMVDKVVYEDLQTYSDIPAGMLSRNAILCELRLSLRYEKGDEYIPGIPRRVDRVIVAGLRASIKLSELGPVSESRIYVQVYHAELSRGVLTDEGTLQNNPSTSDYFNNAPRKTCDGHVFEFVYDRKHTIQIGQINTTSIIINLRVKCRNKDMQGRLVLGPSTFSRHATGIEHWKEMLDNPFMTKTQSHNILLTRRK